MVPSVGSDVAPFEDWTAAARGALAFLHGHVGLDVWMLTRVAGEEQIVLVAHPRELVPAGVAVPWDQSFCRRMIVGAGPRVSTVTAATPAYANLLTGHAERVAAYVGVPLMTRDDTVFGTLCGVSRRAQPRSLARSLPVVEMTARMLSTVLALTGPDAPDDR
ncbi:MAG: putative sensor protein [Modestobacter sp.]|jgi:GAF domain-containing protein|nr:putative sensor protein [Modestobacter sp.]